MEIFPRSRLLFLCEGLILKFPKLNYQRCTMVPAAPRLVQDSARIFWTRSNTCYAKYNGATKRKGWTVLSRGTWNHEVPAKWRKIFLSWDLMFKASTVIFFGTPCIINSTEKIKCTLGMYLNALKSSGLAEFCDSSVGQESWMITAVRLNSLTYSSKYFRATFWVWSKVQSG